MKIDIYNLSFGSRSYGWLPLSIRLFNSKFYEYGFK